MKTLNEFLQDISEEQMDWKGLSAYAKKQGGIDKKDFETAAGYMKKGDMKSLRSLLKRIDTEPRDRILSSFIPKNMWKELGFAGIGESMNSVPEGFISRLKDRHEQKNNNKNIEIGSSVYIEVGQPDGKRKIYSGHVTKLYDKHGYKMAEFKMNDGTKQQAKISSLSLVS